MILIFNVQHVAQFYFFGRQIKLIGLVEVNFKRNALNHLRLEQITSGIDGPDRKIVAGRFFQKPANAAPPRCFHQSIGGGVVHLHQGQGGLRPVPAMGLDELSQIKIAQDVAI